MDNDSYRRFLEDFWGGITDARYIYTRLADVSVRSEWPLAYQDLQHCTCIMCESLCKAGCLIRDISINKLDARDMGDLSAVLRDRNAHHSLVAVVNALKNGPTRHELSTRSHGPTTTEADISIDRFRLACIAIPNELHAELAIHQRSSNYIALGILRQMSQKIATSASRLHRILDQCNAPDTTEDPLGIDYRQVLHLLWERKGELIEVSRVVEIGLAGIDENLNQILDRR